MYAGMGFMKRFRAARGPRQPPPPQDRNRLGRRSLARLALLDQAAKVFLVPMYRETNASLRERIQILTGPVDVIKTVKRVLARWTPEKS